jgi:hypothetical protein
MGARKKKADGAAGFCTDGLDLDLFSDESQDLEPLFNLTSKYEKAFLSSRHYVQPLVVIFSRAQSCHDF